MLEITTSWEEKGRQEGRQEGWREGIEEGRRDECRCVVRRLLQRRLGSIDTALQSELGTLSIDQLESLAEALLDFSSVADLHHWLAKARTN